MNKFKTALTRTTLRILRPLIRVLLKNGVSQKEFDELARRVFVEVGFKDFKIEGKKQTVSRVSVVTGLNRKEVLRIQRLTDQEAWPEASPLNRAARVISGWLRDPEFLDETGEPLILPKTGAEASFEALVKRHSGDITSGAILIELLRVKAVQWNESKLQLCEKGYIPSEGEAEKARIMGVSVSDLLSTIEHNIEEKNNPRFQREVVYRGIPQDVAEEFKELSEQKATRLLLELNQWLAEKKRSLQGKPKKEVRVGMGAYYFENEKEKEGKK